MKPQRPQRIRAICYYRLSVNRSGETLAIDRQREDCRALIERNGWQLAGEYSDDNRSAWHEHTRRKGYDALCETIRRGECDVVVVYETDRLARRLRRMLDLFDLLKETGVVVHSVKSGLIQLDSPMNIANAQMKAVFAEQYVNDARDKNLRARLQAAQAGKRHVTARPYGWEEKGLIIRPDEAAIVQEIVKRLIVGETGTAIARSLNERGILTIKGAHWTGIGVRATATRASNAGLREHHGTIYDGTWEPIITRDEWERVCRIVNTPTRAYRRGTGRKYPFTGFVLCGQCEKAMSVGMGRANHGRAAYRCDQRKSNETVKNGCGAVQRQQIPLDWFIKEVLIRHLDGDALRNALAQVNSDEARIRDLTKNLRDQQSFIDDLVDSFSRQALQMSVTEFNRSKLTAEARLHEITQELRQINPNGIMSKLDFTKSLRDQIMNADIYTLRDIAELVIKEVRVNKMPPRGWRVKYMTVDGVRYRFDPDLIDIRFNF